MENFDLQIHMIDQKQAVLTGPTFEVTEGRRVQKIGSNHRLLAVLQQSLFNLLCQAEDCPKKEQWLADSYGKGAHGTNY